MNKLWYHLNALLKPACLNIIPRHTSSAVRVIAARHGNLSAVIYTWAARHGKKYCKLCKVLVEILCIRAKALCIMWIKQIEKHIIGLLHVVGITSVYSILKILIRLALIYPEILDALSKRIVHNRIELISTQPRKSIMPYFSQNVNIRIDFLKPCPKLLAESVWHLICHIKAQSVYMIIFYPVGADIDKVFSHRRIICIELWHIVKKSKRIKLTLFGRSMLKVKRPFIDHKPVVIFWICPLC